MFFSFFAEVYDDGDFFVDFSGVFRNIAGGFRVVVVFACGFLHVFGEEVCKGEPVFWVPCVEAVCRRDLEVGECFLAVVFCGFFEMWDKDVLPDLVPEF